MKKDLDAAVEQVVRMKATVLSPQHPATDSTEDGDRRRAAYKGFCSRTGTPIHIGDEIVYHSAVGWQRAVSIDGLEPIPENVIYFHDESKNRVPYIHGDIVRRLGIPLDGIEPRILFVLGCRTEGDPGNRYTYTTICRLATDEEAAAFVARECEEITQGKTER